MPSMSEKTGSVRFQVKSKTPRARPESVELAVGDLIGRHAACVLQLHHARMPLVAACVVRRGRRLFLEGQGLKAVIGPDRRTRVRLTPGTTVDLGPVTLTAIEVRPPIRVLAVSVADFPLQELVAPYYALKSGSRPDLLPGEVPGPDAEIVNTGGAWRISVGGRPFDPLVAGRVWQVAGTTLRTAHVDTRAVAPHGVVERLVIETTPDRDHIQIRRPRRHSVTLRGRPALLLRSAVLGDGRIDPTKVGSRAALAATLDDLWDAFRAHGLRTDLVRSDGLGGFELFLNPSDQLSHKARRETG